MVGAVIQNDAKIDHWKSSQEAVFRSLNDPFFHSWDIVLGNRAAENLVHELEFCASGKRFHSYPAVAELAVPAGLFLVAALHVGLPADGFAIRNLGGFQRYIHPVTLLKPTDNDLDVLLPAAAQQKFLGLRIAV